MQNSSKIAMNAIRQIVQALRVSSRQTENKVGLSGAQLFVLQKLKIESGPISLGRLSDLTLTHLSSVSAVVSKLVDSGYLTKVAAADDCRRMDIDLTPSGHKFLSKAPPTAQSALVAALKEFSKPERELLATLLQKLVTNAGFNQDEPPMFFEKNNSRKERDHEKSAR